MVLNREARVDFIEKVKMEQRFKRGEGVRQIIGGSVEGTGNVRP